jgi:high-affinity nickel-transport protein
MGVYSWAFERPVRRLWYNLTVTATSVLVALLIGGLEALGLLAGQFGFQGSVWRFIGRLDDDMASTGFLVIGLFLFVWATSALVFRWKTAALSMKSGAGESSRMALYVLHEV